MGGLSIPYRSIEQLEPLAHLQSPGGQLRDDVLLNVVSAAVRRTTRPSNFKMRVEQLENEPYGRVRSLVFGVIKSLGFRSRCREQAVITVHTVFFKVLFGNSLSWRVIGRDLLGIAVPWVAYLSIGPVFRAFGLTAPNDGILHTVLFWCLLGFSALTVVWRSLDSSLPMWCAFATSVALSLFGLDAAGRIVGVLACIGLTVRVAASGSYLRPSADGADDGPFVLVLVFGTVTDAATWQQILNLIRESAEILSGPGVRLRTLAQGSDSERPDALFTPDALTDMAERLSTARYQILGINPDQGRIEIYRDEPFDFLEILPPAGWSKRNLLRLGFEWHQALDSHGLRTILGGTGLSVRAADVRNFRDDAEHGYAIQGLEYSSPNPATLHGM